MLISVLSFFFGNFNFSFNIIEDAFNKQMPENPSCRTTVAVSEFDLESIASFKSFLAPFVKVVLNSSKLMFTGASYIAQIILYYIKSWDKFFNLTATKLVTVFLIISFFLVLNNFSEI